MCRFTFPDGTESKVSDERTAVAVLALSPDGTYWRQWTEEEGNIYAVKRGCVSYGLTEAEYIEAVTRLRRRGRPESAPILWAAGLKA